MLLPSCLGLVGPLDMCTYGWADWCLLSLGLLLPTTRLGNGWGGGGDGEWSLPGLWGKVAPSLSLLLLLTLF